MSERLRFDLGTPALLEFRGPDAVRFLNGQLTQDVRLVAGAVAMLPSCVTDAKGRLQFRVRLTEAGEGVLWLLGEEGAAEALEARLTRYLIADDVEVTDCSGRYRLHHFLGAPPAVREGVPARRSMRFGSEGVDWLLPAGEEAWLPPDIPQGTEEQREALRIANGIPAWEAELQEGLLPPEANLDRTDISYRKGCYIGQEVISRMKSAGKVNKRLEVLHLPPQVLAAAGDELVAEDAAAGVLTSVSPAVREGVRPALGYVKRSSQGRSLRVRLADGSLHDVSVQAPLDGFPAEPR